jgi:hypothetical protein
MHEDFLGYLLGALEPDEMRRVAELVRKDPEARRQLAEIERSLEPLEEGYQPVEPPPKDLVERSLANLPPQHEPAAETPAPPPVTLAPMQSGVDAPKSAATTWIDWIGGTTAAVVILGLLLPSLAQGRFEARKIACQDHFRQLGTALTQFVFRNQQERLPAVAEMGSEAFAGIYAMRLKEAGLLSDPSIRWCPSLDPPPYDPEEDDRFDRVNEVVSIEDLHRASADQLRDIQRMAGGNYTYNLGVMEQDRLAPPRYESRANFAVMSDAPLAGTSEFADWEMGVRHSGMGINVLFEDGQVRFIPLPSLESLPDHPLFNDRGEIEAGVNINDASLAPSWRPPFAKVRQR